MGKPKCPLLFISKHLQRLNFTVTHTKEATHCCGANARNDFKKGQQNTFIGLSYKRQPATINSTT